MGLRGAGDHSRAPGGPGGLVSPLVPDRRERWTAFWFGPKGFAAVVYGLLVLQSGIPAADSIFHLVALTITLSIVAHSSTDVIIARRFGEPNRS